MTAVVELLPVGLQLIGTGTIAWLAVRWAERRFRSENRWDRRSTALSNLVMSLGEMQIVTGRYCDHFSNVSRYSDDGLEDLAARFRRASVEFEQAAAIAQLILPEEIAELVNGMNRRLEAVGGRSAYEQAEEEYGIISQTLERLIRLGKDALR